MILPKTIDEVIARLEQILQATIEAESPLGFFAALYQNVTIRVKHGIDTGRFEDPARMERLDVIFANRYIKAYHQYQSGQASTQAWQLTFEQAKKEQLIILQHLFLGMNAHINLDLGIAAAEVNPDAPIDDLKADFMEINKLLFEMIEEVQADISEVSPLIGIIDWVGKDKDEQIARFSMKAARQHAWLVAQRIRLAGAGGKAKAIQDIDQYVKSLGTLILNPGWFIRMLYRLIRFLESKDIKKGINALRYQATDA